MVELRAMTSAEIDDFFPLEWQRYKETLLETGESEESANANIEMNKKNLFIDGELRDGNFLFYVTRDGVVVGDLWIARQTSDASRYFIYDIEITEAFRGQGLGRATMEAGEQFVKSQGGRTLELNVFWMNETAKRLYTSMGYEFTSAHMRKAL